EEEDEEEDEEEEDEHSEVSRQVRPFGDVAFEDGLRLWALQNSLTHHALNQLLAHFRQHIPQYSLPEDSKTFLNPPATHVTNAEITKITGGQMWYQGIKKCLEMYFRDVPPTEDGLVIDFFVNGQPLQMLEQFVANYGTVYSTTLLDSNVHNLLHVHKDVKRYGDLSTLSAYPFEAKVQDLKKLVRSGRHRLLQAANRIHELQQIDVARSPSDASEGQASVHSSSPD
uniref:Uncharacterized protein n=1 Tax=Anopheles epiroticus TaxID=199890 RepID=A0A182P862_9DIPT